MESIYVHRESAYEIAFSILRNHDEADDAASISFLKAWEKLEQLREAEKAKAWLFSIVHNTAVDHYRQRGSLNKVSVEQIENIIPDKKADPAKEIMRSECNAMASFIISGMNPSYSEILTMSVVEAMTPREVRERLGINEKQRSVRLCRAKKEFRKKLAEMQETEDLFAEYMV